MCLPWRCRQLLAIVIITSVVCEGQLDNSGKVYPRGNHWAVGHLMGKKSTDAQVGSEEGDRDRDRGMGQSAPTATGDTDSDRTLGPASPLWPWARTGLSPAPDKGSVSQTLKQVQKMVEDRRQLEEQRELQRHLKEVAELLLQALATRQSNSS